MRAGLLLPASGWWPLRLLAMSVAGFVAGDRVAGLRGFVERGGLVDGGSSNSLAGTDPTIDRPNITLTADRNR